MLNYITTMIDAKKDLIKKNKVLKKVKKNLKKEYFGIDREIDELISYIEPWYIFNDIQNKPTIINLWGCTGVGKTSLIQRLFHHLEIQNNLYRFDVRTLLEDDQISTKMSSLSDGKDKIGIIFDEFQNARTLDQSGFEQTQSGLRGLWDLLDSGKIEMTSVSYAARRVYFAYNALRSVIDNGVKIKKGVFKNKIKYIKTKLSYDDFQAIGMEEDKQDKNHIGNYLSDTFYDIKNELPEYMGFEHICSIMDDLNTEGVIAFFEEVLEKLSKPKIHDFTKSIIFIIGNLDEVYTDHSNFNPDMDADMLNKLSNKITITDVKSALSRRFRSEQIARLGNNHLIYPTLDVKSFKDIISLELKNINADIKGKYDVDFSFKNSIHDILYKECVFPTQGARPVYNRINSIIRPIVSKIMKSIYEDNIEYDSIEWSYRDKSHKIKFKRDKGKNKTLKFDFNLKIEDLRESTGDDSQYKVAVHEAGHAVCCIVNMKLLPKSIYSKTANSSSKGFCSMDLPDDRTREFYDNYIKMTLGGYVAEKIVFGDDQLSDGCHGDFQSSTSLANKMVKLFGMYGDPMLIVTHNSPDDNYISVQETSKFDKKVKKVILKNLKEVERTLKKNKNLFFIISKYLTENSFIDQKNLKKLIEDVEPSIVTSLKDKDNYFEFKGKYNKFFDTKNK